jgi:hypothetical protein
MSFAVAKDAVHTTAAAGYSIGSGSLTVALGTGALFPVPTPSVPILITVVTAATYGLFPETFATYQATGISVDTLTGLTLIDGTDTAWIAGAVVEMRTCAKHINDLGAAVAAAGTVTSASVVTANGVSASVANATTTPAFTFTLLGITPTSVAATGTVGGSNLSGTNTGDQVNVSGTAGTITGVIAEAQVTGLVSALSVLSAGVAAAGTVTSVSVATANGFAGTVATPGTTPAITVKTTITGLLKGNGTAIAAAAAGTDYQVPVSLTTTGTAGAATFISGVLNVPQYAFSTVTEVSQTTSFTAGAGAFYAISGAANLTATLPTAVGIAGQTVRIRCANSYTGLCTIATTSAQTINGAATRIIFAGESPLLQSDGTNWVRTGGAIVPVRATMHLGANAVPGTASVWLSVPLDTLDIDNTGVMVNITSHAITVPRPGNFVATTGLVLNLNSFAFSGFVAVNKGGTGTQVFAEACQIPSVLGTGSVGFSKILPFVAGDVLTLGAFCPNISNTVFAGGALGVNVTCTLDLLELPAW